MRTLVLGAGSWGTALAHHLAAHDIATTIWARERDILKAIADKRENPVSFPGQTLSANLKVAYDIVTAVKEADAVVVGVPAKAVRSVLKAAHLKDAPIELVVNAAKGLEPNSLKRMSEVIAEEVAASVGVATLSGPSFAFEVIQQKPTAVTVAAKKKAVSEAGAELFHHGLFRVYTSTDLIGVELGGVFKNVLAIACGVLDGLEMGANARAALITRGLAEMQRLVIGLEGDPLTVAGLSGLGDLLLTATGDLSRNRRVGLKLAEGLTLERALEEVGQTAEGVDATGMVLELARREQIALPITEQVYSLLQAKTSPEESITSLFTRERKAEH